MQTDSTQSTPWNLESLLRPPLTFPTTDVVVESISSFYFEGEPYRGHPTRVSALIPAGVTGFFFNLLDHRNLVLSSELVGE